MYDFSDHEVYTCPLNQRKSFLEELNAAIKIYDDFLNMTSGMTGISKVRDARDAAKENKKKINRVIREVENQKIYSS